MEKIVMYVEVKIKGVWEFEQRVYIKGNDTLFALLADVNNDDGVIIPISFPKGFPADCSEHIKQKYSNENINCSFLTLEEILDYDVPEHEDFDLFMNEVYYFGNELMCDLFVEDTRFVFWFNS